MRDFEGFFAQATGCQPHGYQQRFAKAGLPGAWWAPTGAGKTGLILAWLWRRLHGPDQAETPRRLVYALPPRAVLDEVAGLVATWLANLGLTEEVALHVVLGDRGTSTGDWRENMHQPAVIVGTAETLVSKALLRGYGIGAAMYPIDFALVTNGVQWIIDEARLCPAATATLRQLAGWAAEWGTAEPFGLMCMSSLTDGSGSAGETIAPQERTGELAVRLGAVRTIRRAAVAPGDYPALADAVRALHRAGTTTMVVLNTVPAAQEVYRRLRDGTVPCTLLHPQLRGVERVPRLADIAASSSGRIVDAAASSADRIVVATGDIASALDLSAAVLVTEAAPWPSMVRRAGRCNRTGTVPDAEVWWAPPAALGSGALRLAGVDAATRLAIDAACAELSRLEGAAVTGEDLAVRKVWGDLAVRKVGDDLAAREVLKGLAASEVRGNLAAREVWEDLAAPAVSAQSDLGPVVSRAEFLALFDTSPASSELDIARYVRAAGDLDVDVAWVTWTPGPDGAPDPEVRYPAPEHRCRVPIGQALKLAATRPVWRIDREAGEWRRAADDPQWRPRPFELLLVDAADGGYDRSTGFDLSSRDAVPGCPELLTPGESAERVAAEAAAAEAAALGGAAAEAAALGGAALGGAAAVAVPAAAPRPWQSLDQHSEQVRDQCVALLTVLRPAVSAAALQAAAIAAYAHDAGKAHPIWQDALCALAAAADTEAIAAGRPWAKSGTTGALHFAGEVHFRHELASLLLLDGPLHDLLADTEEEDLVRYLVLAHHGQLRVRVGNHDDLANSQKAVEITSDILGLKQGARADIPPTLGHPPTALTVDLAQFFPGSTPPWTSVVAALRDRFGPFTLAYLETLVRIADWRGSGGRELATETNAIDISPRPPQRVFTSYKPPLEAC